MAIDHARMGLKRPESLDKQLAIQEDIRAMRKAITFGQRDSSLINQCLRVAEHAGLNSEETMVLLAYESLCMLEEVYARELERAMLDIRSGFFVKKPPDQL